MILFFWLWRKKQIIKRKWLVRSYQRICNVSVFVTVEWLRSVGAWDDGGGGGTTSVKKQWKRDKLQRLLVNNLLYNRVLNLNRNDCSHFSDQRVFLNRLEITSSSTIMFWLMSLPLSFHFSYIKTFARVTVISLYNSVFTFTR